MPFYSMPIFFNQQNIRPLIYMGDYLISDKVANMANNSQTIALINKYCAIS